MNRTIRTVDSSGITGRGRFRIHHLGQGGSAGSSTTTWSTRANPATARCSSTSGSLGPETGPHPLIVWIHGGGWIYGSRRRLTPDLFDNAVHDQMVDAGWAVAAVDYRLAREAGFAGMLLDVKAAVRWLRG